MDIRKRITGTFLVRGTSAVFSLASAAVLVRIFGVERFGVYAFALLSARLVAAFSLFSLDSLKLRILLRSESSGKLHVGRAMRESTLYASTFSTASFLILLVACAAVLLSPYSTPFWLSLAALSPAVILLNSTAMHCATLRAERRDVSAQLLSVAFPAVIPPLLIVGWNLVHKPPSMLPELAMLGALAAASITARWLTKDQSKASAKARVKLLINGPRRMVYYSSKVQFANIANYLTDWFAFLILSVFGSFSDIGVMRIFQQFGQAFDLLTASVEVPISTEIAKAHARGDRARIASLLTKSQIGLALAGAVTATAMAVLSPRIFPLFHITLNEVTFNAFCIFLLCYVAKLSTGAAASSLNLMDTLQELVRASLLGLGIGFVLQVALTPSFGLFGAASAAGLAIASRAFICLYFVRRAIRNMD